MAIYSASCGGEQNKMDFVTKCALKGEEMIKDVRAFHPVITGVN